LKRHPAQGFTLVELMVVVGIIGTLVAVAIPTFRKYQGRSRTVEARLLLTEVFTAENTMFSDFNTYAECIGNFGMTCPTPEGGPAFPCDMPNKYYSVRTQGNTVFPYVQEWGDGAITKKGGPPCISGPLGSVAYDKSIYLGTKLPAGASWAFGDVLAMADNTVLLSPTTIGPENFYIITGGLVSAVGTVGAANVTTKADRWAIDETKRFYHLTTGY
jgi:prepilin-type N-terminal cleavage/methylation domain-containing protein